MLDLGLLALYPLIEPLLLPLCIFSILALIGLWLRWLIVPNRKLSFPKKATLSFLMVLSVAVILTIVGCAWFLGVYLPFSFIESIGIPLWIPGILIFGGIVYFVKGERE
ncbi:MAG: hypothetical protein K0Q50_1157 [Vampirovibrio sp.]|jgi:hypothetical protein|nr:hypothetical protein [Vampirovibrio sp.]